MAELMLSHATFTAVAILISTRCSPIKWRSKGCQQQLLWICFISMFSPVIFPPILSYDVPTTWAIGGKNLNRKESNLMTELLTPGPTIPLCIQGVCDKADDVLLSLLHLPGRPRDP